MSDPAVGLVVEGPTDAIAIQAALKGILIERPFIPTVLQPQMPPGEMGGGWRGVYKWLRQATAIASVPLAQNPTLRRFDLIIVHVDADVAGCTYGSANITDNPHDDLPCIQPCPPASDSVEPLALVVENWAGPGAFRSKAALCIPSQCIEAWVAVAVFGQADPGLLQDIECNLGIVAYLGGKPLGERIRKRLHDFRRIEEKITQQWALVEENCPQAAAFSQAVRCALPM